MSHHKPLSTIEETPHQELTLNKLNKNTWSPRAMGVPPQQEVTPLNTYYAVTPTHRHLYLAYLCGN